MVAYITVFHMVSYIFFLELTGAGDDSCCGKGLHAGVVAFAFFLLCMTSTINCLGAQPRYGRTEICNDFLDMRRSIAFLEMFFANGLLLCSYLPFMP